MAYKLSPLLIYLLHLQFNNAGGRNNSVPSNEPCLLLPLTSRSLHVLFPLPGTLCCPLTTTPLPGQLLLHLSPGYHFLLDFPLPQDRVRRPSFVPIAVPRPNTCPAALELSGSSAKPGFDDTGCAFSIPHCNLRSQNIVGTQSVFLVDQTSK